MTNRNKMSFILESVQLTNIINKVWDGAKHVVNIHYWEHEQEQIVNHAHTPSILKVHIGWYLSLPSICSYYLISVTRIWELSCLQVENVSWNS